MAWFFFCSQCKVKKSSLRGWYINADGYVSTDSEGSTSVFEFRMVDEVEKANKENMKQLKCRLPDADE